MVAIQSQAQIRLLAPADAALHRDVRLEALRQNPEAFGSTFEQENEKPLSWFEERLAQTDVFGAFVKDELLGIAGYWPQDGLKEARKAVLWGMYVKTAVRNSGVGRHLVEAVIQHASPRVELLKLTVISENEIAQRLYAGLGFVEYGREMRSLKQAGRYYDEILMVKFLAPT